MFPLPAPTFYKTKRAAPLRVYLGYPPAPDAPSVADVLRAIHRGRIVLFGAYAGGESPSGAIHDRAHARAADSAVVWAMFYWLWRVRGRRTLPVLVRHDPMSLAARAK
ncbi:MAG: hypothetical protein DMG80_10745 [Acidobacteria bacterium]|nr:MAG: hypothetical protein DMG80_10745 [Acidobacteriota bacterium]